MQAKELENQIKASLESLARETDEFKRSEFFREYLTVMRQFHSYSYHNQMLIYLQATSMGFAPSRVRGFQQWNKLNRHVKSGSKAIYILAPFQFKRMVMVKGENGEEKQEEKTGLWFKPVPVFDVSQTDGAPLPKVSIAITGDNYRHVLTILASFCAEKNIKLEFKDLGINGLYGYSRVGSVAIDAKSSVNQQVTTLFHEIAHELIHTKEIRATGDKQTQEIQAEATAHVLAEYYGIETHANKYLALYDADANKIMENLKTVSSTVKTLITYIDAQLSTKETRQIAEAVA